MGGTGGKKEEAHLHLLLAMHAGFPYQKLPAARIPRVYHMDAGMALAWGEDRAVEGVTE